MNPDETIILAEQHRAELIGDATIARRHSRRPNRRLSRWLLRRADAA